MSVARTASSGGGDLGRRTTVMLLVILAIGAPAAILRITCVGHSCDKPSETSVSIPFCSLPTDLRSRITAGFRDGRSPDVFGIPAVKAFVGGTGAPDVTWPTMENQGRGVVPLWFWGAGVEQGAIPGSPTLDSVAPTLAKIMALDRPHPEVRSGHALDITNDIGSPRLVIVVVTKGLGNLDYVPYPEGGAGTARAQVGSTPLDPTAILTTIGTGGLPRQHGITGTVLRNEEGVLTRAWSKDAPISVIAALGDDLGYLNDDKPLVGIVEDAPEDLGLVGGNWYVGSNGPDDVVTGKTIAGVRELLHKPYGADEITDLIGVTISGGPFQNSHALDIITDMATRASAGRVTIVYTATGAIDFDPPAVTPAHLATAVDDRLGAPVTEAVAPGGLYLDQKVLADEVITEKQVTQALLGIMRRDSDGGTSDAFPAIAVTFERYC